MLKARSCYQKSGNDACPIVRTLSQDLADTAHIIIPLQLATPRPGLDFRRFPAQQLLKLVWRTYMYRSKSTAEQSNASAFLLFALSMCD